MSAADGAAIAIVDYGMGNRRSVEKALEHVGASAFVTADEQELYAAPALVLPGVGAFPRAMSNLRAAGLDALIVERVNDGTPVLGICLGMQLAFDSSQELGGDRGLGIVPGTVEPLDGAGLKLPHIGWTEVYFAGRSDLARSLPAHGAFYHVHSFAAKPADESDVLARATYGSEFVTGVARGSFYGVQFHPEKSSTLGLHLLRAFAELALSGAPA
jgi:glutamine amidotransferase